MEKLQFVWDDKSINTEGLKMHEKTMLTAEQIKAIIFETVENAMQRGNSGVSISFMNDGGIYVNVYPYNDDDEKEAAADV